MLDYFILAVHSITARKMRTLLTMIGIFIGVAAVVSLISIGQGLQDAVTEQFENMGVDKIMVMAKGSFLGIGDKIFEDEDAEVIRKTRGVKRAGGMLYKSLQVSTRDETKYTFVTGIPQDETKEIINSMSSFTITHGRDLKKGDRYKAVVGSWVHQGKFFDRKVDIGDSIQVEGKKFEVIGVISEIGNPQDDSQLLISLDVARDVLEEPDKLDIIIAQVNPEENVEIVAERMRKDLRKSRGYDEGDEDFTVQTSAQLMESFGSIFAIISAVLIGIAVISLLVGGVGIMNTMYTSVLERTPEIGIMKAIGARNEDVFKIFLIESGILGLGGGIIGVILGVGISKLVEIGIHATGVTFISAYFSWYLIVGALSFSFIVGVLSGILPAMQASKLITVDALRYE